MEEMKKYQPLVIVQTALINKFLFFTDRSGSVIAKVEMTFGKSITDPLKPLEDEIKDGKLGAFGVKRELDLNPSKAWST